MANLKINILGKNIELTDQLKSLVNEKAKHFEKFLPVAPEEEVLLNVELEKTLANQNNGQIFRAEFNINYKSQFKRSEETQDTMAAAIEVAADELVAQIKKTKERSIGRVRRGANIVKKWLRFGRE